MKTTKYIRYVLRLPVLVVAAPVMLVIFILDWAFDADGARDMREWYLGGFKL